MKQSAIGVLACTLASPAHAAYVVDISQVGADVVATGSGSLNLGGVEYDGPASSRTFVDPRDGGFVLGVDLDREDDYDTNDDYFPPFGAGDVTFASSGSGDHVGIIGSFVAVPRGYVFGAPLRSTATFADQTLATMGLRPGRYTLAFGSRGIYDSLTVNIVDPLVSPSVPEPSVWAMLVAGIAAVGAGLRARRRSVQPRPLTPAAAPHTPRDRSALPSTPRA